MTTGFAPAQTTGFGRGRCMISPPTTDFALVFPLEKRKFKFDKSFYSPALTDGRMSTDQLKSFLKDIERQVKKKLRPIKCAVISYIVLIFFGLFSLMGYGTEDYSDYNNYSYNYNSTYSSYDTDSSDYIDYSQPAYGSAYDNDFDDFVCAFFMYFLFVLIGGILLQVFIKRRHNKVRKCVQAIIDNSKGTFALQGLRWNISMGFPHWIELWKDYKGQNMTMIAPPQQYNYIMPAAPQVFQQPMNGQPMTTPAGYPIFSTLPTYHTNLNFNQQPLREPRRAQSLDRDQYIPPNLAENNA